MQKERKNKEKKIIDNSHNSTPIGFHAEIDKGVFGMRMTLQSITAITDVEGDLIIMKVGRGSVTVRGSELDVITYENRIIEISGKISAVEFL